MPALAPKEELEITTRRAPAYGARATSRGATRQRDFHDSDSYESEARVLAPQEIEAAISAPDEYEKKKRRPRTHRHLQISVTVGFFLVLIFVQMIAGLLLGGMALTATHRAAKLGDATSGEIGRVNDAIALTQKQTASLGSPSQIERWANAKGWKMASPQSFDDIRQNTPPPQISSNDAAPENGNTP